jgi:hypothetical protein
MPFLSVTRPTGPGGQTQPSRPAIEIFSFLEDPVQVVGFTPIPRWNYLMEGIMAREGSFILDSGDKFPTLSMETVNHGQVTLPDAFRDGWGVFLVYRAHW